MTLRRNTLLALMLGLAASMVHAQQPWPSRPIRIVVPFPAGGLTDVIARVVGQALGEQLKTSVVVENKAGAHAFIGGADVAKSPADGYTLLVGSVGSAAINPMLHERMPYDQNRDFAPVSLLVTVPIVVMVNPQALPVQSMQELLAYAKANPGKVNFASAGNGGSSHMVGEYLKHRTGVSMVHIPYRGESPATADVVAGQVPLMFNTLVTTLPYVTSGKVRILATTSATRLAELPSIPAVAELPGLKDFQASSWIALYAPSATPPDIVKRLSASVDAVLKSPAIAKRLKDAGANPEGGSPERMEQFQRAEQEKWGKVIRAANIKPG